MMSQWRVLFRKEWMEMRRNFKILWLPLVFILLGISQPLTVYYLPEILERLGELPDEAIIQLPSQTSGQVLAGTLSSQFDQLGLIIAVLGMMGAVASEKMTGELSLVLVRPVSFTSYVTSKWASVVLLLFISLAAGYGASYYYVHTLFGPVAVQRLLSAFLLYGAWFLFVGSVVLFLSSLLKSSGAAAGAGLVILIGMKLSASALGRWMEWSPSHLLEQAVSILVTGSPAEYLWMHLLSTGVLSCLLAGCSILYLKRMEVGS